VCGIRPLIIKTIALKEIETLKIITSICIHLKNFNIKGIMMATANNKIIGIKISALNFAAIDSISIPPAKY
jgi:hypothetical protein